MGDEVEKSKTRCERYSLGDVVEVGNGMYDSEGNTVRPERYRIAEITENTIMIHLSTTENYLTILFVPQYEHEIEREHFESCIAAGIVH